MNNVSVSITHSVSWLFFAYLMYYTSRYFRGTQTRQAISGFDVQSDPKFKLLSKMHRKCYKVICHFIY
jgi:hypothetical protein